MNYWFKLINFDCFILPLFPNSHFRTSLSQTYNFAFIWYLFAKKINQNIIDQVSPIAPGVTLICFSVGIHASVIF